MTIPAKKFFLACGSGRIDIVRAYLDAGGAISVRDGEGHTPLMNAARKGQIEIIELLLEHGAELEAVDKRGRTAFFQAVRYGRIEAVRCLAERGANLNPADAWGRLPLDEATGRERPIKPLIQVLKDLGARSRHAVDPKLIPRIMIMCPIEWPEAYLVNLSIDRLRGLFKPLVGKRYSDSIVQFVVALTVHTSSKDCCRYGLHTVRHDRADNAIWAYVNVPRTAWGDKSPGEVREYLAVVIRESFRGFVARAQKNKLDLDAEAFLRDTDRILESFLTVDLEHEQKPFDAQAEYFEYLKSRKSGTWEGS